MIGVLPVIYKEELLYSFLSRYSVLSGYTTFRGVAEELYVNSRNKPNILLLNKLTNDLLDKLSSQVSLKDIVMNHTMFKWFIRFAGSKRMKIAFNAAMDMNIKLLYDSLPISQYQAKYKEKIYLRYCPICAILDRKKLGETHFRTYHQIPELKICPKHKCYLQSTQVPLSKGTPLFLTAESTASNDGGVIYCKNSLYNNFAEYILQVEQAQLDMDCNIDIGDYFSKRLYNSKYINKSFRNMRKLTNDFNDFYSGIQIHRELWQLQKILTNYCYNSFEICLLAYYLGITSEQLCKKEIIT